MKKTKLALIISVTSILAGCMTNTDSVTTGPGPSGSDLEQRIGQDLPADAAASYNSGTDTVTVSANSGSASMGYFGPGPVVSSNVKIYADGLPGVPGANFAMRQTTASGQGKVVTIGSPGLGVAGTIMNRTGAVQLPTSGTANHSGEYGGLVVNAGDKNYFTTTSGSTCLTANFGAGNISGTITQRGTFADIAIAQAPIAANGTFATSVTGGQDISLAGNTTSNGQLSGMFVGASAGETVGGLRLDHVISGNSFYEVGGFTTSAVAVCP